jgi:hypothetical protein
VVKHVDQTPGDAGVAGADSGHAGGGERAEAETLPDAEDDHRGEQPGEIAGARRQLHGANRTYTHVLFIAVEGAGAETHTRQTVGDTKVAVLGGLELSYLLLQESDNTLVNAGSVPLLAQARYHMDDAKLDPIKRVDLG